MSSTKTTILSTVINGSVQCLSDTYGSAVSIKIDQENVEEFTKYLLKHKLPNMVKEYNTRYSIWVGLSNESACVNEKGEVVELEKKMVGKFQLVFFGGKCVLKKCKVGHPEVVVVDLTAVEDLL